MVVGGGGMIVSRKEATSVKLITKRNTTLSPRILDETDKGFRVGSRNL